MTQIVVLSGGMDSATVLGQVVRAHGREHVAALAFDYNQRHRREIESAKALAKHYGVIFRMVPTGVLIQPSALTGGSRMTEVPEGHYAERTMAATVVPGRNLLFASIAVALAEQGDCLWFGVHSGDHPIYPDCRPSFWTGLTSVVQAAYGVSIITPYLTASKADIVRRGDTLDVPYGLTWSCYVGDPDGTGKHCGRCGTCVERAEAFYRAMVDDPTDYADATYWREMVGL